jgi:NitT/TauT family transport system substrate-binding protein
MSTVGTAKRLATPVIFVQNWYGYRVHYGMTWNGRGDRRAEPVRYANVVLATVALFLGTALPAAAGGQPPSALTHLTLQLKWLPQAQFAGYFVAQDLGFYRRQGLDVSIKPGGPSIAPEKVVQRGKADIGVDWLSALLVARDRGADLTSIAQIFQSSGMRLIAWKSTGIHSIAQLRGKKVGVWFAGNQYQFYALMSKNHLSPPGKYMSVISQDFTMKQFLTHAIDAGSATTYNELGILYEHGVKPGELTIFDYNRLGVSVLEDGLFARPGWLRSHASIASRFLRASIQGWRWAVRHPDQAGAISFRHQSPGFSTLAHQQYMARQVAKLVTTGLGGRHAIGYMDPRRFTQTWRILLAEHVIHQRPHGAYNGAYWRAIGGR